MCEQPSLNAEEVQHEAYQLTPKDCLSAPHQKGGHTQAQSPSGSCQADFTLRCSLGSWVCGKPSMQWEQRAVCFSSEPYLSFE